MMSETSKEQKRGGGSTDRVEGDSKSDEGEGRDQSLPEYCIFGEFSWSGKAENYHFVWVHVYVHAGVASVCLYRGRTK